MALALAATVLAACGGSSPRRQTTLALDFTPNAVHTGIYAALARQIDRSNGIRLHLIIPGATTDSIKLLEAGRVSFAILDIHDLAIARERGARLVGVMAIVERPLASLIAAPSFPTPPALAGHPVGITGAPSDTAVLDSIVSGAGGDPHRVHTVTIGFNAVADILAGRVAAATAFWNDEGVTLRRSRPGVHVFKVEDYGAPSYPELVLCVTAATLSDHRSLVQAVVRALVGGYRFTLLHPARGAAELEALVPALEPALLTAQLRALLPAFRAADGRIGELDTGVLARWARWEQHFGIVAVAPDVRAMFDPAFADAANAIGPFG